MKTIGEKNNVIPFPIQVNREINTQKSIGNAALHIDVESYKKSILKNLEDIEKIAIKRSFYITFSSDDTLKDISFETDISFSNEEYKQTDLSLEDYALKKFLSDNKLSNDTKCTIEYLGIYNKNGKLIISNPALRNRNEQ